MKKIYLIPLLLLIFCCMSKSYSQKIIYLDSQIVKKLDVKDFSKIEIINNLPDSNILGYIPSDVMNNRKVIKSSESITLWLQSFVDRQFVTNPNSNKKILWVIDDLSMGTDSTKDHVNSYLKLKGDIYSGTNDSFQLINTFDSTWIIQGDAKFWQMTRDVLVGLYQHSVPVNEGISNTRFFQMSRKLEGTLDDIKSKIKKSNQIPILRNNVHPPGVFSTFEDFRNNAPSITNFYANVDSATKKVQLYQIAADSSSSLIQNAWGISVNNELYYYDEGQLYPIERSGNTFYMAKYLEPRTRKNQAFYWRKIIGARQGDTNPYNDAHELLKKVPTANNVSLEATHLDFDKKDFVY